MNYTKTSLPLLQRILELQGSELAEMEKEFKRMPPGSLFYQTRNNKAWPYYQYYAQNDTQNLIRKQQYLPKREQSFIERLKRKRYLSELLPLLQHAHASFSCSVQELESIIKRTSEIEEEQNSRQTIGSISTNIRKFDELELSTHLDSQISQEKDVIVKAWLREMKETSSSEHHRENLIHNLSGGLQVRSKSEMMIANTLQIYSVPFCYEATLKLSGRDFSPDFTIMRRRDHKIFYWEHFGLVHEWSYRKNMKYKLEIYEEHNIVPWDNLLISYDTEKGALDLQVIQHLIQGHLL